MERFICQKTNFYIPLFTELQILVDNPINVFQNCQKDKNMDSNFPVFSTESGHKKNISKRIKVQGYKIIINIQGLIRDKYKRLCY